MTRTNRTPWARLALAIAVPLALLGACASDPATPAASTSTTPATATEPATEQAAAKPRLAVTYDGGVQILDATTLEVLANIPVDGYVRLNAAGDGRHALVSTSRGFEVLDLGTWSEAHGDHAHHFTSAAHLTGAVYPAQKPSHVVVHDGRTALFDDGTGAIVVVDSSHVAAGPDGAEGARRLTTPTAHHGVAVELDDGSLVVSDGTAEERTSVRLLDAAGQEDARTDACPGVHGEAVAQGDAVLIGCEDGAVLVRDGEIAKIDSPDAYGRIGNQAGSHSSTVVLGDYKSDPDAELERPTRVSLIDTQDATLTLVDLPASYTFRSLERADDGAALVLGTDGAIHVIDPEKAQVTTSVPVIDAWEEPLEWQQPRPAIRALDGSVYVTDPATRRILAVDVETGKVWREATLDVVPDEIVGVTGEAPEVHDEDHADGGHVDGAHEDAAHEDAAHEGHDHD